MWKLLRKLRRAQALNPHCKLNYHYTLYSGKHFFMPEIRTPLSILEAINYMTLYSSVSTCTRTYVESSQGIIRRFNSGTSKFEQYDKETETWGCTNCPSEWAHTHYKLYTLPKKKESEKLWKIIEADIRDSNTDTVAERLVLRFKNLFNACVEASKGN